MIRFIDQDKDGQLHYKAGGGITAQSNNDDEYKEVIEKVYVPIYWDNKGNRRLCLQSCLPRRANEPHTQEC